ncbi:MAG: AraC family transcriptional regulator [Eubacteriales bacterium]|nr:AraC family transcriptional regulator [Eubacteriales bacterium]
MDMKDNLILQQPFLSRCSEDFESLCINQEGISSVYEFTAEGGQTPDVQAVPDGVVDLMFHISDSDIHCVIGGTVLRFKRWPMEEGTVHFGVRFQAGECILPEEMDIQDIINDDLEIDLRWFGDDMEERLADCTNLKERSDAVRSSLRRLRNQDKAVRSTECLEQYVRKRIFDSRGILSIRQLSQETGYSECYLRRAFSRIHGISPKMFATFLRFQYVLHMMNQGQRTLEEIALECGYYDQSHMIKEFKKFSGTTPEQYYRMISRKKSIKK